MVYVGGKSKWMIWLQGTAEFIRSNNVLGSLSPSLGSAFFCIGFILKLTLAACSTGRKANNTEDKHSTLLFIQYLQKLLKGLS